VRERKESINVAGKCIEVSKNVQTFLMGYTLEASKSADHSLDAATAVR